MKIIICAYREWGINAYEALRELFPDLCFKLVKSPDQFDAVIEEESPVDAVFCIGWSWRVKSSITKSNWVVGVHPSDLPEYAGGSPLQHQIMDGVRKTKMSLFRLTQDLDEGPVLAKMPLSLDGHMDEIFRRLTLVSVVMFSDFIRSRTDKLEVKKSTGTDAEVIRKRVPPAASKLSHADFSNKTARELYDLIRCHEDPYPNCYMEDHTGQLFFKKCVFKKRDLEL